MSNKCQLSLIDPRDGIVLWTELDGHCDSDRMSELGGTVNN